MNEMFARAGAFFLAPPTHAAARTSVSPPAPTRAAVLAAEADLLAAAGTVAGALRARNRAGAAVVCLPVALRPGGPGLPSAASVARRLGRRDLDCRAVGSLCRVHLPADPVAFVVHAWRVLAAADAPVVVAIPRRDDAYDDLLSALDLLALATAPDADPVLAGVAAASLERLGPPVARLTLPRALVARRAASAGLLRVALPEAAAA